MCDVISPKGATAKSSFKAEPLIIQLEAFYTSTSSFPSASVELNCLELTLKVEKLLTWFLSAPTLRINVTAARSAPLCLCPHVSVCPLRTNVSDSRTSLH